MSRVRAHNVLFLVVIVALTRCASGAPAIVQDDGHQQPFHEEDEIDGAADVLVHLAADVIPELNHLKSRREDVDSSIADTISSGDSPTSVAPTNEPESTNVATASATASNSPSSSAALTGTPPTAETLNDLETVSTITSTVSVVQSSGQSVVSDVSSSLALGATVNSTTSPATAETASASATPTTSTSPSPSASSSSSTSSSSSSSSSAISIEGHDSEAGSAFSFTPNSVAGVGIIAAVVVVVLVCTCVGWLYWNSAKSKKRQVIVRRQMSFPLYASPPTTTAKAAQMQDQPYYVDECVLRPEANETYIYEYDLASSDEKKAHYAALHPAPTLHQPEPVNHADVFSNGHSRWSQTICSPEYMNSSDKTSSHTHSNFDDISSNIPWPPLNQRELLEELREQYSDTPGLLAKKPTKRMLVTTLGPSTSTTMTMIAAEATSVRRLSNAGQQYCLASHYPSEWRYVVDPTGYTKVVGVATTAIDPNPRKSPTTTAAAATRPTQRTFSAATQTPQYANYATIQRYDPDNVSAGSSIGADDVFGSSCADSDGVDNDLYPLARATSDGSHDGDKAMMLRRGYRVDEYDNEPISF